MSTPKDFMTAKAELDEKLTKESIDLWLDRGIPAVTWGVDTRNTVESCQKYLQNLGQLFIAYAGEENKQLCVVDLLSREFSAALSTLSSAGELTHEFFQAMRQSFEAATGPEIWEDYEGTILEFNTFVVQNGQTF